MKKLSGHIPVLDGIRGLAILLVLVAHFNDEAIFKEYFPLIGPVATKLALTGLMGVDLFFILSGFLITGILLKTKDSERYFLNFYARRVLRIFPLYYCVLLVIFWVLPACIKLDAAAQYLNSHQWWLWTYLSNFPGHPSWDSSENYHLGHFWSLAVEEHFYLVWPFIVYSFPVRQLKKICLSWTVFSVVAGLASCFADGWVSHLLRWSTICFSGGLTLGSYGALIAIETTGLDKFVSAAKKLTCFAGLTFVGLGMVPRRIEPELITLLLHYVSWALFSAIIILVLTSELTSYRTRFFSHSIMTTFGKLSYGLYVYHYLMHPTIEQYFDRQYLIELVRSPLLGIMLYFLISIGISLVITWLSWHLLEKQFLKLKRYFEKTSDARRVQAISSVIGGIE